MKDLGITKGRWECIEHSIHEYPFTYVPYAEGFGVIGYYLSEDKHGQYGFRLQKPDAELFCDAGNTAQKCGLLPSELLEQRDNLIECVKTLSSKIQMYYETRTGFSDDKKHFEMANELIAKIKGE